MKKDIKVMLVLLLLGSFISGTSFPLFAGEMKSTLGKDPNLMERKT